MASDAPRLYVALYSDADVDVRVAEQVRARGYDAISAREAGNLYLDDSAQLEFAVRHKRAMLTHNAQDFEPLSEKYWSDGKEHFGIVVSQKLPIGELLRRVLKMFDMVDADEMKNSFRNLGEFK